MCTIEITCEAYAEANMEKRYSCARMRPSSKHRLSWFASVSVNSADILKSDVVTCDITNYSRLRRKRQQLRSVKFQDKNRKLLKAFKQ